MLSTGPGKGSKKIRSTRCRMETSKQVLEQRGGGKSWKESLSCLREPQGPSIERLHLTWGGWQQQFKVTELAQTWRAQQKGRWPEERGDLLRAFVAMHSSWFLFQHESFQGSWDENVQWVCYTQLFVSVLSIREWIKKKESIQRGTKEEMGPGSSYNFLAWVECLWPGGSRKWFTKLTHFDPAGYSQLLFKAKCGFFSSNGFYLLNFYSLSNLVDILERNILDIKLFKAVIEGKGWGKDVLPNWDSLLQPGPSTGHSGGAASFTRCWLGPRPVLWLVSSVSVRNAPNECFKDPDYRGLSKWKKKKRLSSIMCTPRWIGGCSQAQPHQHPSLSYLSVLFSPFYALSHMPLLQEKEGKRKGQLLISGY